MLRNYAQKSVNAPLIFSYNRQGLIQEANDSLNALAGQSRERLNVTDIFVNFDPLFDQDEYQGLTSVNLSSLGTFSVQADIKRREDMYFAICSVNFREQLELEKKLMMTNQEISNLSREVFKQKEQLERVNKLKDEFVSILSHDLRGPLRRINSFAQLLKMTLEPAVGSDIAEYLNFINKESLLMHRMVVDILNFEAIESGKFKLNPEKVDIQKIFMELFDVFQSSLQEKAVKLDIRTESANSEIEVDRVKIRQVIENIVINCIRYSPEQGVVCIKTFDADSGLLGITISDEGPGFTDEEIKELFVPFRKGIAAGSSSVSFGFGMAIVKRIVSSHHGSLEVKNAPTGGAMFTIKLPVKLPAGRE
jgi:signal transduction histidine kinase